MIICVSGHALRAHTSTSRSHHDLDDGELVDDFLLFVDEKQPALRVHYAGERGSGDESPTTKPTTTKPLQKFVPFTTLQFENSFPGLVFDSLNGSLIATFETCLNRFYSKFYKDIRNVKLVKSRSMFYASFNEYARYTVDFDLPEDASIEILKNSLNKLRDDLDKNLSIDEFEKITTEAFNVTISIGSRSLINSIDTINTNLSNMSLCDAAMCINDPFVNKVCNENKTSCLHVCDDANQVYCKNNGICKYDPSNSQPNCTLACRFFV